jgi:hypothetical protein
MSVWSSMRRLWARHDEHLAENEVERESTGVELQGIGEKAAYMDRVEQVEPREDAAEPE